MNRNKIHDFNVTFIITKIKFSIFLLHPWVKLVIFFPHWKQRTETLKLLVFEARSKSFITNIARNDMFHLKEKIVNLQFYKQACGEEKLKIQCILSFT